MHTRIMGILNATPDSFSDGGLHASPAVAAGRAAEMVVHGADIIDIGAESTRPGAVPVASKEQLHRLLPVLGAVRACLGPDILLSVDTSSAMVASAALDAGADLLNVCGGLASDPGLASVASRTGCPVIIFHRLRRLSLDVIADVRHFFERDIALGLAHGMRREQFVLDPGFGFAKSREEQIELLLGLGAFADLGLPLAIGVSRKSHLSKLAPAWPGTGFEGRLEAGLAEVAIALLGGVSLVRTHDVRQTKAFVAAFDAIIHPSSTYPHECHHLCP